MGSRRKLQTQHFGSWFLKAVSRGFRFRNSGCFHCSIKNKSSYLKFSSKTNSNKRKEQNKPIHRKGQLILPKSEEIRQQFINYKIYFITLKNNGFYPFPYIFIVVDDDDVKRRIHQKINKLKLLELLARKWDAINSPILRNKTGVHIVHSVPSLN